MKTTRNTMQKIVVLKTVNALKNHPTADEVYVSISKKYPNISRGTVYRNLNLLAQSGELGKIPVPGTADRFDHRPLKHYHAKCNICNKIFDVKMQYLNDLEKSIKQNGSFNYIGHTIIFSGICLKCHTRNKGLCGSIKPVNINNNMEVHNEKYSNT